jgi:hypothetical protein
VLGADFGVPQGAAGLLCDPWRLGTLDIRRLDVLEANFAVKSMACNGSSGLATVWGKFVAERVWWIPCEDVRKFGLRRLARPLFQGTTARAILGCDHFTAAVQVMSIKCETAAKVSLLMSLYWRESPTNLAAALDSVLASVHQPEEVIMVVDGPIGAELQAVLNRFADLLPLRAVYLERNVGLAQALNLGLQHCRATYVARFDTDDLMLPPRLALQIEFLDSHRLVSAVGSQVEEFDHETGAVIGERRVPCEQAEIAIFARIRNPMNHPSVMFRRADVIAVGGYPAVPHAEDYALWLRLLAAGHHLANLPHVLVRMRSGVAQMGRRRGFSYIVAELQLLAEMRRLGFASLASSLRFLLLRLPLRLLPARVLQRVYRWRTGGR